MIRAYEFKEEAIKQIKDKNELLEKKLETLGNCFKSFQNDFYTIFHSKDVNQLEALNSIYEEELKL